MKILKLLKVVGKDFVKGVNLSFKELGLCIFTGITIMLFMGVIAVIPAIILHYIWFNKFDIDDLSVIIILSESLIAILVGVILDFKKYIKKKWNEVNTED